MPALTAVKVNQHRKYNAIHGIKFKYKHDRFEQRTKQKETVKLEKQHLFTYATKEPATPFPTNCNNLKQPTTSNMNNNNMKSTANTNMTDNLTNPVSNVQKKSRETKRQVETVRLRKQHLFTSATNKPTTPFPTNCNNLTEPTTSSMNNNNIKSVTNENMANNLTNPVNNVKKKEPRNKKAEGNRYYSYDQNGNVIAERDGSHATAPDIYRPYYYDGDIYSTDYGFGVVRPQGNVPNDGVYQRNYRWNERNLMSESSDSAYTVNYRYGADGQRALKHVVNNNITTLYFNKMWTKSSIRENWLQSKHIYLGEERIATKFNVGNNTNTADEQRRIYYYHTDHLGSAQTITNYQGVLHERLEYTPYGELWINYIADTAPQDATPFRFTGQELDKETGLYYYGARYLDPRTSRWLSTDPAMYQGDYIPGAPVNDEARKRNGNLPGMGGVYNYVNLHVYHYAANNPVKYVDPDGREGDIPEYYQNLIQSYRDANREQDQIPNNNNIEYKEGNTNFSHYQPSYSFIEGLGIGASYSVWGGYNISQRENGEYYMNINVNAISYGANNVGKVRFFGSVKVKINGETVQESRLIKYDALSSDNYIGSTTLRLPSPDQNLNFTVHLEVSYIVTTSSGSGSPFPRYNRRIPILKR